MSPVIIFHFTYKRTIQNFMNCTCHGNQKNKEGHQYEIENEIAVFLFLIR